MEKGLVSVVIPAYNVEKYLEKCVCSLLKQTYKNYEIIIIDDGSTDKTFEVSKMLELRNSKVKAFHQENQGVSVARNQGMQYASGNYYLFVDADDYVSQKYVEALIYCVNKADMAMVGYTSKTNELEENLDDDVCIICAKSMRNQILCGVAYDGYLWNKIFRSDIVKQNGMKFEKNVTVWEDMFFVLEYLKCSKKVHIIKNKLYYYRYREESAVNNLRIDKYRSKYEIMKKLKNLMSNESEQCRHKISYLYYETMLSYINKAFYDCKETYNAYTILKSRNFMEFIQQKNVVFILKYIYLQLEMLFSSRVKNNIYAEKELIHSQKMCKKNLNQ